MAEIDVVKKPSRTWLWVILAIVLAVVAWMVFAGGDATRGADVSQVLEQLGLTA